MQSYYKLLSDIIIKSTSKEEDLTQVFGQVIHDTKEGIPSLGIKDGYIEGRIGNLVNFFHSNFDYPKNSHQLLSEDLRYTSTSDGVNIDQLWELIEDLKENSEGNVYSLQSFHPENEYPVCLQFISTRGNLHCSAQIGKSNALTESLTDITDLCLLIQILAQICSLEPGNLNLNVGASYMEAKEIKEANNIKSENLVKLRRILFNSKLIDPSELEESDFFIKEMHTEVTGTPSK